MSRVRIGNRWIGDSEPVYVVAEVSANHAQSFDRAAAIVRAAKSAGADAVKLQTYTPDTLTIDCAEQCFRIAHDSPWIGKTLYELYSEASTPWEWHANLKQLAEELRLGFFSTPFDSTAVAFLQKLNVPAFKIASFELVDLPLLKAVARTGKPVISSTGMASFAEIQEAVATLRSNGTTDLVLLKCTSAYPALPQEMNLRTIPHLADTFGVVAGLSDHTLGGTAAIAAVALGARVIEKHLTLRRSDGGPDSRFSMEPEEFADMVSAIRETEQALGKVTFEANPEEARSIVFRRSLFVVEKMEKGEAFTLRNVRPIRPGYGLHTRHLEEIVGRKASRGIARGTPLSWDLIEN